jgi:hypothetical protein
MLKISDTAGIEDDLGEGEHHRFLCQGGPGEQQE